MVQSYTPQKENDALWQIQEGMVIYDWDDRKVGIVKRIELPNEMICLGTPVPNHLHHAPLDVGEQLSRTGYIQVEGGLFSPDCYVLPEQILEVNGKQVVLNALKVELIQF